MFCLDFVSRPRRLMLTMFVQMGIEAESRKKTITTQKLAIRIAPLGTKQKLEPAAGKLDHHVRLPPALCIRARSCRFICKAVVKIGWSCC